MAQALSIKTLPLHGSQEIVAYHADEVLVKVNLCITTVPAYGLAFYSADMKVLQPSSSASAIKLVLKKAFAKY